MRSSPSQEQRQLLGILSVSLVQLGFEFLIMKVARYQFGTLSIGVIAVALLGVAAAALSVRLFKKPEHAIAAACVALPVVAWLCIAVQTAQGFGPLVFSFSNFLVAGFLAFVVLALCSVPVFAYMQANVGNIHRYYAASFLGGAIGIPVTLVLLEVTGDLLTASALLLLTVLPPLVLVANPRARALGVALAIVAATTSVPAYEYLDSRAHRSSTYRKSDALSRIDVRRRTFPPAYAADPSYDARMAIQFNQGGRGGHTLASPVAVEGPAGILRSEIRFLPWSLPAKRALVLGSGGGLELTGALRSGATEVHAVEIDGKVLDYLERFAPASHNPYVNPKVTPHVGEGRDISARIGRSAGATFDLVYIPTALLRAQSGQVFAQTHLITEEALYEYFGLLNETGILALSFPIPGEFRARVVSALSRALTRRGVRDTEAHIRLFQGDPTWVVLGKAGRPFTDDETSLLLGGTDQVAAVDVRSELEAARGLQPFDDNHPFMFPQGVTGVQGPSDETDPGEPEGGMTLSASASTDWNRESITVILASAALLIVGVFALGVRAAGAGLRSARAGYLACFTAIGGAYVIYQTLMLQRLSFLVGHPMLASAFILTTALVASGAGSWLSGGPLAANRTVMRAVGTGVLICWIIALSLIRAEWMILPAVAPGLRVLAGIALCAPPFIMMGTYFAVAMKRAEREAPGSITWGWGLNGIAAIAGWAFMVGGSMSQGIRFIGLSPALAYGAVGIWEYLTVPESAGENTRRFAHRGLAVVVMLGLAASLWLSR